MPSPTMARGLIGHLQRGADPPATDQKACPIADIFILTGNISSQGWGRKRAGRSGHTKEPEGQRGWGRRIRGEIQGRGKVDGQGRLMPSPTVARGLIGHT